MKTVQRRATAPYCTCRKVAFGFMCVDGEWVVPCCQRPTKTRWLALCA